MSYLVEQLPHCDLLRLSLSTGWFVLSARQVVTVWKDFLVFSVPGASFLDTRHYGCVSHWLTELTLSQNFANPLCLFTRRCRAPGCDGFLILRKFFQNPPCLFTRRCRPVSPGRPAGRAGGDFWYLEIFCKICCASLLDGSSERPDRWKTAKLGNY